MLQLYEVLDLSQEQLCLKFCPFVLFIGAFAEKVCSLKAELSKNGVQDLLAQCDY